MIEKLKEDIHRTLRLYSEDRATIEKEKMLYDADVEARLEEIVKAEDRIRDLLYYIDMEEEKVKEAEGKGANNE